MGSKKLTKREFLKYGSWSFLFLLNACTNLKKKPRIFLQNHFYPDSLKETIPNDWKKENINFEAINLENNINVNFESDLILINDGWLRKINFNKFKNIDHISLLDNLDDRSIGFLDSFADKQRKKLFPIGVVPYAIVIKNNLDLINSANQNWDFLLSKKLTGKIIFPQSPRVLISIAKKIKAPNSLAKLKRQVKLFDDKNSLNWLINSDACLAIVPYNFSLEYSKIDPRLSIVFPNQGVPLTWFCVFNTSNSNSEILIKWIKSLQSKEMAEKLAIQGWYLPFKNNNLSKIYNPEVSKISGPSQICWENSWYFPLLSDSQKLKMENYWEDSLSP